MVEVLPVFSVRDVELELSVAISDIDNKIVGHHTSWFPGINIGQQAAQNLRLNSLRKVIQR